MSTETAVDWPKRRSVWRRWFRETAALCDPGLLSLVAAGRRKCVSPLPPGRHHDYAPSCHANGRRPHRRLIAPESEQIDRVRIGPARISRDSPPTRFCAERRSRRSGSAARRSGICHSSMPPSPHRKACGTPRAGHRLRKRFARQAHPDPCRGPAEHRHMTGESGFRSLRSSDAPHSTQRLPPKLGKTRSSDASKLGRRDVSAQIRRLSWTPRQATNRLCSRDRSSSLSAQG